jgi:hypothetical protein
MEDFMKDIFEDDKDFLEFFVAGVPAPRFIGMKSFKND